MPLTLIYLGPSLGLATLFRRRLDVVVFLAAAVALDLEPLILFLLGSTATIYWSHNFFLGTLIGVLLAYLIHLIRLLSRDYWHYLYPSLGWSPVQEVSRWRLLFSGAAGAWSHLFFDRLVVLGLLSTSWAYFFSLVFLLIGLGIAFRLSVRWVRSGRRPADDDSVNMV